jgi:hypothetical protein
MLLNGRQGPVRLLQSLPVAVGGRAQPVELLRHRALRAGVEWGVEGHR